MSRGPTTPTHRHGDLIVCVALILAIFWTYWGVFDHSFVNYDDPAYITENPHLAKGFSMEGLRWAFTSLYFNFWQPLTWLSYFFDMSVYGMNAGGFLFTNLVLHIAGTLMLYAALRCMTGSVWRSGLVVALFALHPLNVESVAWVSERKNVLSTVFWMATLWTYARYAQRPRLKRYVPVFLCFLLGLMAKPMLVTLPFVLLLLDAWPLRRWGVLPTPESDGVLVLHCPTRTLSRLVIEKVPFFALTAGFSVMAYVAQDRGGALSSMEAHPLSVRLANALMSYGIYLRKMVWPSDLTVLYPHPGMPAAAPLLLSVFVLLAISWMAIRGVRARPWLVVGWLWYLGSLVPVIGLVQIGQFSMADRFAYVPLIGVFVMVAWSIPGETSGPRRRRLMTVIGVLILLVVAGITRQQVRHWRDSRALFTHALAVVGSHPLIHNSLGVALEDSGDTEAAIGHYREALRRNPGDAEIRSNLGAALMTVGETEAAEAYLLDALRRDGALKKAKINLGNLYARRGALNAAIIQYRQALAIDPASATAYNNLGVALARKGDVTQAIAQFRRALELKPGYESAANNLTRFSRVGNVNGMKVPHVP